MAGRKSKGKGKGKGISRGSSPLRTRTISCCCRRYDAILFTVTTSFRRLGAAPRISGVVIEDRAVADAPDVDCFMVTAYVII